MRSRFRTVMRNTTAIAVVFLISIFRADALGPHEVAVIVNSESAESVLLGRSYCALYNIPACNLVRLNIPKTVYNPETGVSISPEEFRKYIWEPLEHRLKSDGIFRQILACVYSCGFPVEIKGKPGISITGATFVHGNFPTGEAVQRGTVISPLFTGPEGPGDAIGKPFSFDQKRNELLFSMPMPAMMLAFTGTNGISFDDAMKTIDRNAGTDASLPNGTIYFQTNNNIRSMCRMWEFESTAAAISKMFGNATVISADPPPTNMPLVGYMTGAINAAPEHMNIIPGAYCDNLTSFGAAYGRSEQTKATEWLHHGAAASSGTVNEPYALWQKFPHAAIFVYMLSGCSAIESLYLSVKCPMQLLPIGDPLCAPWAKHIRISISGLPTAGEKVSGKIVLTAIHDEKDENAPYRYSWLVDGKRESAERKLILDTTKLPDGIHTIRAIVKHMKGTVRLQSYSEAGINVENP